MMEEHAMDEEAVKQAPIRLLPIHQLTEEQPQGAVKCSSVVEGPAMQGVVADIYFLEAPDFQNTQSWDSSWNDHDCSLGVPQVH